MRCAEKLALFVPLVLLLLLVVGAAAVRESKRTFGTMMRVRWIRKQLLSMKFKRRFYNRERVVATSHGQIRDKSKYYFKNDTIVTAMVSCVFYTRFFSMASTPKTAVFFSPNIQIIRIIVSVGKLNRFSFVCECSAHHDWTHQSRLLFLRNKCILAFRCGVSTIAPLCCDVTQEYARNAFMFVIQSSRQNTSNEWLVLIEFLTFSWCWYSRILCVHSFMCGFSVQANNPLKAEAMCAIFTPSLSAYDLCTAFNSNTENLQFLVMEG